MSPKNLYATDILTGNPYNHGIAVSLVGFDFNQIFEYFGYPLTILCLFKR